MLMLKNVKFQDRLPGILALYNHSAKQQFYNPAFKLKPFEPHCGNLFLEKKGSTLTTKDYKLTTYMCTGYILY